MQSLFDLKKEEDLYSILNCVDSSTSEQIRTEYKRLALQHHPDKNSNSAQFDKIKAAYDILGDPAKRALYDRWKASGLIIPFSQFAQLGTHAQTVHWQSLPSQLTITDHDNTSHVDMTSIRTPSTNSQRVQVESTSFWKKKDYIIQDRPN
ncbi:hypothetical protein G6F70_001366 [Rhizopus microsporus]|uniref:J domain-containing protein n=1 Tax=Rhizopus azygosporus TaxID=86630 RepID=A0A367J2L7_RHIAZ|nr:hypothetical protein G6F71_007855 [Rhizopus microsporus]RCH84166.1 hypothetical protein CU097_001967 [Rhizopus azygosporus]KAG1203424.1 hypothetical protein G6F70_001366 [Rhizopus microsporus]KAG1215025.1 hypothetical protein G6F69_001360 [Rhizopus microsporus]KAG1229356.1 hypothetical protein G6F67_007212 [Rhizopus microsporus]